jgi:NTF2 fold immunity protein
MNVRAFIFLFAPTFIFMVNANAQNSTPHNVQPAAGYVPNAETAIRIAVAIWEPMYGKELIAKQKPYIATLKDDVWIVQGSLPKKMLGGTAIAQISKNSAEIVRVSHGK